MYKKKITKKLPLHRNQLFPRAGEILPASVTIGVALAILFSGCGGGSSPKFKQYYRQGEGLYAKHCSNCHQKDGTGLGRLYPPLNASDYMVNNFEDVICLIRMGKKGPIVVNGLEYNHPMPGIPTLSDLEVAEIATYIYNTWSHRQGIIEVRDVSAIMERCRGAD